jgi:hypothetical protein
MAGGPEVDAGVMIAGCNLRSRFARTMELERDWLALHVAGGARPHGVGMLWAEEPHLTLAEEDPLGARRRQDGPMGTSSSLYLDTT